MYQQGIIKEQWFLAISKNIQLGKVNSQTKQIDLRMYQVRKVLIWHFHIHLQNIQDLLELEFLI